MARYSKSLTIFVWIVFSLQPSSSFAQLFPLVPVEELGLRVASGFHVTLYADEKLANDIFAMTLDAQGRVVVTGPGYIKILHDTNNDGVADQATLFAPTRTGGMGLCFDGNNLLFAGDGALSLFHDRNGDGQADGPPEVLFQLGFAEHGVHAMRKGPDGAWYLIGGNDTGFGRKHATLPNSPIREVEAGALLRITPDLRNSEIIAHGLRNPYDFDFNWLGDLFTYDSDVESDYFLPWYTPTRIYQVAYGGHHGWRLNGWMRSWNRPAYYADTTDILAAIGRGSPTGVACYRHTQFPDHYHGGLFALDWVFGKIYFLPLQPIGASYVTQSEVFLEPIGTHGFAPTDIAVAPDGSLFVSIGGRKTRGAVYHIQYVGPFPTEAPPAPPPMMGIDAVLQAPQPLEAWSRAHWIPIALNLGRIPFNQTVANNRLPPEWRVRAVEVLTELYGGLQMPVARAGALANSPAVRARVAWSLDRIPCDNFAPILLGLVKDREAIVRRCALEAIADHAGRFDEKELVQVLPLGLAHTDKRVRVAAARAAALLSADGWQMLEPVCEKAGVQASLSRVMAEMWRAPAAGIREEAIEKLIALAGKTRDPGQRLQVVRLMILALGDYHLNQPSVEVYTAYEPAFSLKGHEQLAEKIRQAVRPILTGGDTLAELECARLLAMLEDDDPATTRKVVAYFTSHSLPASDFHCLVVLSRLRAPFTPELTTRIANVVLALDQKLAGQETRNKQNWTARLTEVVQAFLKRDPKFAETLLKNPNFAREAHLSLAGVLGTNYHPAAARLFFDAAKRNPKFAWSGPLIDLLATLPSEEARPLFRRQWGNFALRDELVLKLAPKPDPLDRDKFIYGLSSLQPAVTSASLTALLQLPRDQAAKEILPAIQLLRRTLNEPKENPLRSNLVSLLNLAGGQKFEITEPGTDAEGLKRAYAPVFTWFVQKFPALVRMLDKDAELDAGKLNLLLKHVAWDKGSAVRGRTIFEQRGCQTCHAATTALGPDLGGVTGRLSVNDLFAAINFPSRDVAAPYRTTVFQMRDGQNHTGIVAFESADGVILQTGATTTVRLANADIISRRPSNLSLMPTGLLVGLQSSDLADLHSYLKTLQGRN